MYFKYLLSLFILFSGSTSHKKVILHLTKKYQCNKYFLSTLKKQREKQNYIGIIINSIDIYYKQRQTNKKRRQNALDNQIRKKKHAN